MSAVASHPVIVRPAGGQAPARVLRVAVLGCGNVGSALVRALEESPDLELASVLVRDASRARPASCGAGHCP